MNPAPLTGTTKHVGRHPPAKQIELIKATAEKEKANKKKHQKPKLRQLHRQKLRHHRQKLQHHHQKLQQKVGVNMIIQR